MNLATTELVPRTPYHAPRTSELGPRTLELGTRTTDLGTRNTHPVLRHAQQPAKVTWLLNEVEVQLWAFLRHL
jgi:hypothetical protein